MTPAACFLNLGDAYISSEFNSKSEEKLKRGYAAGAMVKILFPIFVGGEVVRIFCSCVLE